MRDDGERRVYRGKDSRMNDGPQWADWDDLGSSRSRRNLVLASVLALLLICGLGVALRAFAARQAQGPLAAARAYCAALVSQRYDAAYRVLASSARGGESAAQWATDARLHDTIDGRVTHCVPVATSRGPIASFGDDLGITLGTLAAVPLDLSVTRAHLGQRSSTLRLQRDSGSWKIEAVPDVLQGTTLDPLKTVQAFCAALAAANYAQAYTYLSARQVGLEKSTATFVRQATPPSGAKYVGCTPNYITYQVQGTTASVLLAVNFAVATVAGDSAIAVQGIATFVLERGTWRLDGLDLGSVSN